MHTAYWTASRRPRLGCRAIRAMTIARNVSATMATLMTPRCPLIFIVSAIPASWSAAWGPVDRPDVTTASGPFVDRRYAGHPAWSDR